jgi:hypothetical protein
MWDIGHLYVGAKAIWLPVLRRCCHVCGAMPERRGHLPRVRGLRDAVPPGSGVERRNCVYDCAPESTRFPLIRGSIRECRRGGWVAPRLCGGAGRLAAPWPRVPVRGARRGPPLVVLPLSRHHNGETKQAEGGTRPPEAGQRATGKGRRKARREPYHGATARDGPR